ncbi:MAG: DUF2975 domain-containing protein [Oscillibacter sp.]
MESTAIGRIARILKHLVTITFACNLLILPLIPKLVQYLNPALYAAFGYDSQQIWSDTRSAVLVVFLWFCGVCTAVVLWQGRRVLDTILHGTPFAPSNAVSLKRAALCAFGIAAAALARTIWGIFYYQTLRPLATYNALFVPIFAMAGLLCLVMSALFRQAAELKAESDLTI